VSFIGSFEAPCFKEARSITPFISALKARDSKGAERRSVSEGASPLVATYQVLRALKGRDICASEALNPNRVSGE
jgi:hypothetical protein